MISRYYFARFANEKQQGSVVVCYRSFFRDPLAAHKVAKSAINANGGGYITEFKRIK